MADNLDRATPPDATAAFSAFWLSPTGQEIERKLHAYDDMLAALKAAVKWCRRCDGSGQAPNEDGRPFSDDPAFIDCPDCATQRAAIAKAAP